MDKKISDEINAICKNDIVVVNSFNRNQVRTSYSFNKVKINNDFTITQLKIFCQLATLINMDDNCFKEYKINLNEFCNVLGIKLKNKKEFLKNLDELISQRFHLFENDIWTGFTIFSKILCNLKEGYVLIKFNSEIEPFLLNLKERFTKIEQIKYIHSFNSKYSIRIYFMLKDYRLACQRNFSIEELRNIFDLKNKYRDYNSFYNKVIKVAIDEINEKSDIYIYNYEIVSKIGKKINEIKLVYKNKSSTMKDDFLNSLKERYFKYKKLSIFQNHYLAMSEDINSLNDLFIIKDIIFKENRFDILVYNYQKQFIGSIFSSSNENEILDFLFKSISIAMKKYYDLLKQEKQDLIDWQENQDRKKIFKEILDSWKS
ncbi:replication initiation protein [Campylobacter jejuni]|nr:replication initiation protein [Campylobacter jejuni]